MIAKASQVDLKREVEHLEAELGKARKALEALRESNAKHRLLLEKMTDTVGQDTTAGLAMAADAEYESVHGVSFVGLNALVMQRYQYERPDSP